MKYEHILSKSSNSKTSKELNNTSSKSNNDYDFNITKVWYKDK